MGFVDAFKSIFAGSNRAGDNSGYYVYVRCQRCGEPIKTCIDLYNDLSPRDKGGYWVHKTLIGSKLCFERIDVSLYFDDQRRLVDRQINRGVFITPEEYHAEIE